MKFLYFILAIAVGVSGYFAYREGHLASIHPILAPNPENDPTPIEDEEKKYVAPPVVERKEEAKGPSTEAAPKKAVDTSAERKKKLKVAAEEKARATAAEEKAGAAAEAKEALKDARAEYDTKKKNDGSGDCDHQ